MKTIIIATKNKHKINEFHNIFKDLNINIKGLAPLAIKEPIENGKSFEENANIKSVYYSKFVDNYVLSDDSGLCVDALNGDPGIFSSRFAGENATDEDNIKKLLKLMHFEKQNRQAKFVCSLSLALNGSVIKNISGNVEGEILFQMKGTKGFGYDPIFYYPKLKKTFAELSSNEKNIISHRYNASILMKNFIKNNITLFQ